MQGWFDSFRTDGGPTLYAYSNRTSVTGDVSIILICLVFLAIFVGFVIILPGVRKERISTFLTVTLSLLTGIIICLCNYGSSWETSSGEIDCPYRAFSAQKIRAALGVSIGLDHANVTLKIIPRDNRSLDIDFNERFYWREPTEMKQCLRKGLQKGLPYPILTAAEYLALDKEGFSWGRYYRNAGYYTGIILWSAFASWMLSNVLLLNVPRYAAYMKMLTGTLMCGACLIFWLLKPAVPLQMRYEDTILTFRLGWCFWMTLVVGFIVGISGLIISIVDWIYPHKFSTILEVDFDTPHDRHIIIEDSTKARKRIFKIPLLEEPLSAGLNAGSRLLRRLSRRGTQADIETNPGVDNPVFEMDKVQKYHWRTSILMRNDSRKSSKSVNFRDSLRARGLLDIPDSPNEERETDIFERTESKHSNTSRLSIIKNVSISEVVDVHPGTPDMDRQDSCHSSASSASSLGLGFLAGDSGVRKLSLEENAHEPVARNSSGNIIVFHRTDPRGQLQKLHGESVEIQTDGASECNW